MSAGIYGKLLLAFALVSGSFASGGCGTSVPTAEECNALVDRVEFFYRLIGSGDYTEEYYRSVLERHEVELGDCKEHHGIDYQALHLESIQADAAAAAAAANKARVIEECAALVDSLFSLDGNRVTGEEWQRNYRRFHEINCAEYPQFSVFLPRHDSPSDDPIEELNEKIDELNERLDNLER